MYNAYITDIDVYMQDRNIAEKFTQCAYGFSDGKFCHTVSLSDPDGRQDSELFAVQSLTKSITAHVMLIAQKEKVIQLDAAASSYVTGLSFIYNGVDVTDKITLRHLLLHQSGLMHEAKRGNNLHFCTFEEHVNSFIKSQLLFMPGEKVSYSNLGYDLCGRILIQVYKKPFEQIVQEKIFDKLGMNQSSFLPTVDGQVTEEDTTCMVPACGMVTSLADLIIYMKAALNHHEVFLCGQNNEHLFSIFTSQQDYPPGLYNGYHCYTINRYPVWEAKGIGRRWACVMQCCFELNFATVVLCKISAEYNHNEKFIMPELLYKYITSSKPVHYNHYNPYGYFLYHAFYEKYGGTYISSENEIMYCCLKGDYLNFSKNGVQYEPWLHVRMNEFVCMNQRIVFHEEECIQGFYLHTVFQTIYFYKQNVIPLYEEDNDGLLYVGVYQCSTESKTARAYYPDIIVSRRKGALYINRVFLLHYIERSHYIKSNGEHVIFGENQVSINNIIYLKKSE